MKIRVLGSSAGGGLPQWNCGGSYSVAARAGEIDSRSQPSVAVSADGERWSIINASPDIRDQFARFPGLHPRPGTRDIPLDTVLITNADLDHSMGLLVLRESLPYRIVSTPWIRDTILQNNAAWRLMEAAWTGIALERPFALDRDGHLQAQLFAIPGKVPTYLKEVATNHAETTTGLRITDTRTSKRLVYAPGIQDYDLATLAEFESADCRFCDGTFFTRDELLSMRPGAPDARAMGHLEISGAGGSMEVLSPLPGRTIYIHLNNTNPMRRSRSSPEAASGSRDAGLEIAL